MQKPSEWETSASILQDSFNGTNFKSQDLAAQYGGGVVATVQDLTQKSNRYRRAMGLKARLRDRGMKSFLGADLWQQAVQDEREEFYQPQAITVQRSYRRYKKRKEAEERNKSVDKIQKAWRKRKNL
jgi:hypothetical protein